MALKNNTGWDHYRYSEFCTCRYLNVDKMKTTLVLQWTSCNLQVLAIKHEDRGCYSVIAVYSTVLA